MAAVRNAMLSVSPTRLKNFSIEMENTLKKQAKSKVHQSKKSYRRKSSEDHRNKSHKSDKRKSGKTSAVTSKKTSNSSKRKHGHDRSKNKRKKMKKDEDIFKCDSNMEEDGLILKKKFLPLQNYLTERETLLSQAFTIIKQDKISEILPDELKKKSFDDVKQKCMQQLEVMSKLRLEHVILGKELDFSSGTESPLEEQLMRQINSKTECNDKRQKFALQTNEVDSTTSEHVATVSNLFPSASSQLIQQNITSTNQDGNLKEGSSPDVVVEDELEISDYEDMVDELLEGSLESATSRNYKQNSVTSESEVEQEEAHEQETEDDLQVEEVEDIQSEDSLDTQEERPEKPKSPKCRLEILELEMRARAIRSLMKNVNSNIKHKS